MRKALQLLPLTLAASAALVSFSTVHAADAAPSQDGNFGFPLSFHPSKMDTSVKAADAFQRYAAGKWMDAASIPEDRAWIDGMVPMAKNVEVQVEQLLRDAAERSPTAPRGSVLQQVGDFYASGMDVAQRAKAGATPVKPLWARIDKIDSPKALATVVAELGLAQSAPLMIGATVMPSLEDPTQYVKAFGDGELYFESNDDYLSPDRAKVREAYLQYITDTLKLAGLPEAQASGIAAKVLALETRVAAKRVTPQLARDPRNVYQRATLAEIKAMLPNVDVDALIAASGMTPQGDWVVVEREALKERNLILATAPLQDVKDYLKWDVLRRAVPYLDPAFMALRAQLTKASTGQAKLPELSRQVGAEVGNLLGHPLGKLYVAKYFPAKDKAEVEHLVGLIRQQFRQHLSRNTWLTPETRKAALGKLDRIRIVVGYPDRWINTAKVDIQRDDFYGNALRLNTFMNKRSIAKFGKPVAEDGFADPKHTLPTVVNAAYDPSKNGIEIPAAFLQPPFYDRKADVAVKLCTMGAVIGHEMTHGFDSMGRLFDAKGALRDWWTPADADAFAKRSVNLIAQAEAFEPLPGLHLNGQLTSGENLADIGGMTFAFDALKAHLKAHPKDRRLIDGFTPEQRCFLAWAQNWAGKMQPEFLRQITTNDPHPAGDYRMLAPSQNVDGFYKAFGIKPGDKMWVAPERRVKIW
jgi:putative endopeptidase